MKATAGLHHAIRGEYRMTYEANAAKGTMHGFVNFFLAAVLARGGAGEAKVEELLADKDPANFAASDDSIRWRDTSFHADAIETMRESLVISLGSCSFEEPIEEIRAMGWIE